MITGSGDYNVDIIGGPLFYLQQEGRSLNRVNITDRASLCMERILGSYEDTGVSFYYCSRD